MTTMTTATGINVHSEQIKYTTVYAIPVSVEDGGEYRLGQSYTHCLALTGREHDYDCRKNRRNREGLCTLHLKKNHAAGGSCTSVKV